MQDILTTFIAAYIIAIDSDIAIRKKGGNKMKANLGQIDRIIRAILGIVLLATAFLFDLVQTGTGKAIISGVSLIMLGTAAIGY